MNDVEKIVNALHIDFHNAQGICDKLIEIGFNKIVSIKQTNNTDKMIKAEVYDGKRKVILNLELDGYCSLITDTNGNILYSEVE